MTELDNSDELVKTDDKANQSEAIILVDVTPAPKKEPKEDQPSIVESQPEEVVLNTYGDLHDTPVEYRELLSSTEVSEVKSIPQDTV
ncbi:hypothetical protein NXV01_25485 [Bacteroides sp. BFG-606]|nr:hypothetical protein [Bacteroides sp. BFG-606]